jgi:hypothetical protein
MTAAGEVSWPPAGSFLAAYGETLTAADTHIPMRHSALQHNVAAQWLWRTEATQCCVWRSKASFLANLWQGRVTN